MAQRSPVPFRRRNFFVKGGFQTRFALWPILFLAAFLLGAGVYLHGYIREILVYHIYLPHSRLENPWHEISPALGVVALWGGGAFLLALAGWGWRRFSGLRADLVRLADWMAAQRRAPEPEALPPLKDHEVEVLGTGLHAATEAFREWDREVASRIRAVEDLVGALPDGETAPSLGPVRDATKKLWDALGTVRIDEGLS